MKTFETEVDELLAFFGPATPVIPGPGAKILMMPMSGFMGVTAVAVSTHMKNLMATYGEEGVLQELKIQFGLSVANG